MIANPNNKSFKYGSNFPQRYVIYYRVIFILKKVIRWLRVQRVTTLLLNYQYKPAEDLIEIDLTYLCNLRCNNCNRSSAQAPDSVHINLEQIRKFVDESLNSQRDWSRIRLLGGEPTLHPEFFQIIEELERYKRVFTGVSIQVVTNGKGKKVNQILNKLSKNIYIENSEKQSDLQPDFGPFNMAPQDSISYIGVDYKNGCEIPKTCGIGLTPQGYYPCAIAGGIDRVLGLERGRSDLPPKDDEMRDLMDVACRLCGRFRDGHYIPSKLRAPLLEQKSSRTWIRIYEGWHLNQIESKKEG